MIGDSVRTTIRIHVFIIYLQTRGKSKVPGCQVYGRGPNILLE